MYPRRRYLSKLSKSSPAPPHAGGETGAAKLMARMNDRLHAGEGNAPHHRAWAAAMALLEDDLRRRDAADRTRRAYATDLGQFARWAIEQGLAPVDVGPKTVRRYIARLSGQGSAPSTS